MAIRTPFTELFHITAVEPAGNLVTQIMAQAEGLLRGAARQLDH